MINVWHEFIFFHSIAPETLRPQHQQCSPTSSSPASLATGHRTGHLYPSSDFTGGSCNYFKLSTVQSPISASFGAAGKKEQKIILFKKIILRNFYHLIILINSRSYQYGGWNDVLSLCSGRCSPSGLFV